MSTVSIAGLDKAEILRQLYASAKPEHPERRSYNLLPMTLEEARLLIEKNLSFDILNGRVMRINLENDTVDTFVYDRHNGQDVAEQIIENIRKNNQPKIVKDERVYCHLVSSRTGISEEKINEIVGTGSVEQFHRDGLLCPHCNKFSGCNGRAAMKAKDILENEIKRIIMHRRVMAEAQAMALFAMFMNDAIKNGQLIFDGDDPDFIGDNLMNLFYNIDNNTRPANTTT